ncbi:MAG: rRNA maturation RNase YbeY [Alphaproteobacteria bacterium]|nr:rRNA maturation RNase YbeY [Alphaproteobacteria bacterium]
MTEPASDQNCDAAPDPEPDSPDPFLGGGSLTLDIDMRCADWHGAVDVLEAQAQFVWAHLAMPEAEASLVLAEGDFLATLNAQYRDKQGATNVLSFPAQDFAAIATPQDVAALPAPRLIGDIVLAHDVLMAEAGAQGKAPAHHMRHLLTHGLLHLLGHDHVSESAAAQMEKLETDILAAQGLADPYHEAASS